VAGKVKMRVMTPSMQRGADGKRLARRGDQQAWADQQAWRDRQAFLTRRPQMRDPASGRFRGARKAAFSLPESERSAP
jgi:hypothetical protein